MLGFTAPFVAERWTKKEKKKKKKELAKLSIAQV
jgi:hypothetical protein